MARKVLIVTDLFHASPRIPGLCNYIKEFGWEPVILTTPLGEDPASRMGPPNDFAERFRVIEVPYKCFITMLKHIGGFKKNTTGSRAEIEKRFGGNSLPKQLMRKIIFWAGAVIAYPDELRAWRKPATKVGAALLKEEKFDAILSSSSPVTSHRIAKALKKQYRLPWATDLRDLWTENHYYLYPKIRKIIEVRLEKKTLGAADALTTVSEPLAGKLKSSIIGKSVSVIPNGYDPKKVNDPPAPLTKKFTVTYTGTIYRGKQSPEKFFAALHELISEGLIAKEDVEVRFYGASLDWLNDLVQNYSLEGAVKQLGFIPREEVFVKQRESQVLLMFGWEDEGELGTLLTKSFEYYAARRPIFFTGGTPNEKLRAIINETDSGRCAIDAESVRNTLLQMYREYKETGAVSYQGNVAMMDRYSYREMARKFAEVLDSITSK